MPTARMAHYRWFAIYPPLLDCLNQSSAAFGIEYRHPFTDKRLVEFCLALPPEQKFHQGLTRVVMRRGLASVLPPRIQHRQDKGVTLHNYIHALVAALDATQVQQQLKALEPYLDVSAVQAMDRRYLSADPREGVLDVWYSSILRHWWLSTGLTS